MSSPNAVHQAGFIFLPHNTQGCGRGCKIYKYALTIVDMANCFKVAEPLSLKDSAKVVGAFQKTYKCVPLKWTKWFTMAENSWQLP